LKGRPILTGDSVSLLPASDGVNGEGQASPGQDRFRSDLLDDVGMGSHADMMLDASRFDKRDLHHGPDYASRMPEPFDRLREARIKAGYETAKGAAEAMGATVSTYIQHENGSRGFPASRAARYAKFFRVAPEWLLYGRGDGRAVAIEPELTALPLIGNIQAGAWMAVDDSGQEEPEMIPHAKDRAYPHAKQWLREVQGDSMNAVGILPGDLAHLAEFFGAGLEDGMIVEVTRTRDGGALREITLKEVEVSPKGVILWPRSTNPRWKDPVRLNDDSGLDITVEVTGVLVATTRRFRRSR
jgi:SOS-response transcriptional repressor LexA